MKTEKIRDAIACMLHDDENVILADGFEDAFIGIGRQFTTEPFACYDRQKCIDILCENMTHKEAEEYFSFNVEGAYVGEQTPVFLEMYNGRE